MILRMDHIGLVTGDIPGAAAALALLDMKLTYDGHVESYGFDTQFWQRPGDQAAVELVAPAAAVRGHLDRRGPGLHHIAFEVDDIDADLPAMLAAARSRWTSTPAAAAVPACGSPSSTLAPPPTSWWSWSTTAPADAEPGQQKRPLEPKAEC